MNEYSLKITSLPELLRFHRFVLTHGIQGHIYQNDFHCNVHNLPWLAFSLPLFDASLVVEKARSQSIPAFPPVK